MTDGIEKFEITDWDIDNEFNPNRVRHQLTKKQQIYGVFASDESDDEEERPSFGLKTNFSSQINFVSGGIRTVGEKTENKESNEEVDSSDEDVPKPQVTVQKKYSAPKSGLSGNRNAYQIAGLRTSQRNAISKEFGSWEKHTKGIGQKLLLQMGFEPGKGLGKSLQGITCPIEAKLRKGKGAIGLYGPEQPMRPTDIPKQEEEVVKHERQWKKKLGTSELKYVYKTADEVVREGSGKRLSSVKVIDMRGPEQKVLTGYHQIHEQHAKPSEEKSHSALQRNLQLLEREERLRIIQCARQRRLAEDKISNFAYEQERLHSLLAQQQKQMNTLEQVLQIIESLDVMKEESNLEMVLATFKALQEFEEYKLYGLGELAITVVVPLVKKLLSEWQPLRQTTHCIDVFRDWKDLLQDPETYQRLVWDVWMPPVRTAILEWNPREWRALVELLDMWSLVLPSWVLANVLEQLVLPKLQCEVEAWEPRTDTVPVHSWLHPWLPIMGNRLEPLYYPIRQKLASALVKWHPSDCSAKLILEPWKPVFSQGVMDAFVVNNIVPKLAVALQSYIINPHQQHLDVWNWVMAWSDMLPEPCMVSLLEKNFFPKWLQVLYTWLTHSPNYEEVTKWYTGWKSMLPSSLLTNPLIKEQFKQALDIMNRAVSQPSFGQQPGAKESMAYLTNVERQQEFDRLMKPRRDFETMVQTIRAPTSAAALTLSFKDLIQKKAEESDILFMPMPGRYQEGKQVHEFGKEKKRLLYLDRGVIFVFNEKTWVPTSLQSLLDTAE